jgi:hypothetical protein
MKNKLLAMSNKSLHMINKFQTKRDSLSVSEKAGEIMVLLVFTIFGTQLLHFISPFFTGFSGKLSIF